VDRGVEPSARGPEDVGEGPRAWPLAAACCEGTRCFGSRRFLSLDQLERRPVRVTEDQHPGAEALGVVEVLAMEAERVAPVRQPTGWCSQRDGCRFGGAPFGRTRPRPGGEREDAAGVAARVTEVEVIGKGVVVVDGAF